MDFFFFFFFPELFDSKSWKLQITHKTGVSKFCLPTGLLVTSQAPEGYS